MENNAPSLTIKDVENQVRRILRPVNLFKLNRQAANALTDLGQVLSDARIYTQDYEVSETREEQMKNAKFARKYLETARVDILIASEYNIFNAVDVAQLSAQIDQMISTLK